MKPTFVMIVLLAAGAVAHASDRIGVYARVDKVVLEPDAQAPQRVQVWGVFAIADSRDPNAYRPPARGYLYYTLPPAKSGVEGPALSRVEGPALSRVEGPALSRVEGPALSRVEGSKAALAIKEWADLASVAG